jgi:hypothetical protein
VSHELTGGNGPFIGAAATVDLAKVGYEQHEYLASGAATTYSMQGAPARDGRWTFTPAGTAAYRTRVLVRRPVDASKFSGNVLVEWLNVSGGVDADPDWASAHEAITRQGDVWVGVSAQRIGVTGGPVLVSVPGTGQDVTGKGLVGIDPARYGTLQHPGDGYSFDIFTQVGRAVRAGAALGGLQPKHVLAIGESQSAFALVTYVDGVQPLTHAFDGFLVHSRGAAGLPIAAPGKYADIAGSIGRTPAIFRTDTTVPILDVQTETDVGSILDSVAARQPDSNRFRLWEVAGTAHADKHLIGAVAPSLDCGVPINNGAMHVVVKAALHALEAWVDDGTAPPTAPRLQLDDNGKVARDADGIARGGIRTPPVDVPVDVVSGLPGPSSSVICLLLGSTRPLPASRIAQLYPSRAEYLQRFTADADKDIAAGFVLPQDRAALLSYSQPARVTG